MLIDGVNYSWTQPLCETCWAGLEGDRPPVVIRDEFRDTETCAVCETTTRSGIYRRMDPRTVPHPARKEEE
jgi:hypothetical protein